MLAKKSRRSTTEKAKKISFAEEWFDQLKCENEDRIDPSGVLKLCEEIGRFIFAQNVTIPSKTCPYSRVPLDFQSFGLSVKYNLRFGT